MKAMLPLERGELSTAAGGACDEPPAAVGNSGDAKFPACYAGVMTARKLSKLKTPPPTPEEAVERYTFLDHVIRERKDIQLDELESAIGMYMIGFHFGWKVLYVIHSKRTIRKYEQILRISVRDVFEEFGPDADRTNAYKVIQAVSSFWKLVSGDEKSPIDVDKKALNH
jgi:hypothetical protein